MIRYCFREDEPLRIKAAGRANAQTIGESLDKIRVKSGGELEPRDVVNAARDKNNPLHIHFEWDDRVAAESYRVDQARNLIRLVRVVDEAASDGTARAFISVNGKNGVAYRSVDDVKASQDLQEAVLEQAEKDLEAFERRYKELKDICAIVRQAREKVQARRRRGENRAVA
jgi:hypothetical protein